MDSGGPDGRLRHHPGEAKKMWRFLWKPTMSHLLSAKMSRNGGARQAAASPAGSPGWEQRFLRRGFSFARLSSPPVETREFWPAGPRQEAPLPPHPAPTGRGPGGSPPQRGACLAGLQEPGRGIQDEAGRSRHGFAEAASAGGTWARVCACASPTARVPPPLATAPPAGSWGCVLH